MNRDLQNLYASMDSKSVKYNTNPEI